MTDDTANRHGLANSEYRWVVADLLPPDGLNDRENEIAALHAFCRGDQPYGWWQGDAWAGKTVLMASFALDPPTGCSVIGYFISRPTGRNTHTDFTDTVLPQLCDVAGEMLPSGLSVNQRDGHRRRLLEQAAAAAVKDGDRLVLVIDGLDEDAGQSSSDAPTIASLLPSRPPEGLRIIVTSRPATPVPANHPLRKCVPVQLQPSAHAADIRLMAETELDDFLQSGGLREAIVGFLAAAQGGLTADELAELIGEPPHLIRTELQTSRIVKERRGVSDMTGEPAYVLGHEALVTESVSALGQKRIDAFWDRIGAWAQRYRNRGWPPGTPGYLLRTYPQRLVEKRDLNRLTKLALDGGRHNRMLTVIGGDGAAFAEIDDAQQMVAQTDEPDLHTAYLLARHRDHLAARNLNIPAELPALWFTLGHPRRADALVAALPDPQRSEGYRALAVAMATAGNAHRAIQIAGGITDSGARAVALAAVAEAMAGTGQHSAAREVAERAQSALLMITDPTQRSGVLAAIAQAMAAVGDHRAARDIADSITDVYWSSKSLAAVAEAMAAAGDPRAAREIADHATTTLSKITDEIRQPSVLAAIARALAAAGDHGGAREIVDRAATVAESIPVPEVAELMAVTVVEAAAKAGEHSAARRIADSISDPAQRAWALRFVAEGVAAAGEHDTAREIADSISNPTLQAATLVAVARVIAAAGNATLAGEIADQAERTARNIGDPTDKSAPMGNLAVALAAAGDAVAAHKTADLITEPNLQVSVLATLAEAVVADGQHDSGRMIARQAEAAALSITDPQLRLTALTKVVQMWVASGDFDAGRTIVGQATATAQSITDPALQVTALGTVVPMCVAIGERHTAHEVAGRAEAAAQSLTDPYPRAAALAIAAQAWATAGALTTAWEAAKSIFRPKPRESALAGVAEAFAAAGEYAVASQIANSISTPARQASTLTAVAQTAAAAGERGAARTLAQQADAAAESILEPSSRASALAAVAQAHAAAREHAAARDTAGRAEAIAQALPEPGLRASALAAVAHAWIAAGDSATAREIARQAESSARSISDPTRRRWMLSVVAQAAAAVADYDLFATLLSDATAHVICDVAVDLVDRGDLCAARILIVRTWIAGEWPKPLRALAVVDPGLLSQIAAEIATPLAIDMWDPADAQPRRTGLGGFQRTLNAMAGYVDPAAYRRWLAEAEARTARIEIGGKPKGTGFLIGPDLLMTNWHVVEKGVAGAVARFDHSATSAGHAVPFAAPWEVVHSEHDSLANELSSDGPPPGTWDFVIVRLDQPIADQALGVDRRGYYTLEWGPYDFDEADPVLIVGYPRGGTVQLSYASPSGARLTQSRNRVRYDTNTEHGSSGSPVFNRDFRIVALHNAAGIGSGPGEFNQGVPISGIGAVLSEKLAGQAEFITLELGD